MLDLTLQGGAVLTASGLESVDVGLSDGVLTDAQPRRCVDVTGFKVLPGIVDVHGDAFERQVMPRPGVFFPIETAVLETDRQLAANGIATTYHSITLGYEPVLRRVTRGRVMIAAIRGLVRR